MKSANQRTTRWKRLVWRHLYFFVQAAKIKFLDLSKLIKERKAISFNLKAGFTNSKLETMRSHSFMVNFVAIHYVISTYIFL